MQDCIAHGRSLRGDRNPRAKITVDDVIAIRASTDRQCNIARQYKLDQSTISQIRSRRFWAWV
jgi:hypothetical protein